MRVLSLFTGVGGFDLGLEEAGMTTVFQCEIDKHCQSVLQHHWPDVPRWGDVTTLTGRHILDTAGEVDVVAWGSPCQDLSVAGKRAGLTGERSGLFHEGIRIIKELRELTNGRSPVWSVWENVYGALSSNGGADFGEVLWEMDEAGACFSEWAVLDAQYFGVPQRRRRVFVASCFNPATAERCPSPLFPVAESGGGDFASSRKTRQGTAGEVEGSVGKSGDAYPIQGTVIGRSDTAEPQGRGFGDINDPMYTLDSVSLHGVAHLMIDGRRVNDVRVYTEPVQTLEARMGTGGNNTPMVAQDVVGTLNCHDGTKWGSNQWMDENKLVMQDPIGFSHTQGLSAQPSTEAFPTLRTEGNGMAVNTDMVVRRLTPVECERLMGWPDNHTATGVNGPIADTNRYKMCGNGVASPVAAWIGRHLMRCRPNAEPQSFMDHYLDQLEWERSNADTPTLNG